MRRGALRSAPRVRGRGGLRNGRVDRVFNYPHVVVTGSPVRPEDVYLTDPVVVVESRPSPPRPATACSDRYADVSPSSASSAMATCLEITARFSANWS